MRQRVLKVGLKDAGDGLINTKKALIVRDPRDSHSANIANMVENALEGDKQKNVNKLRRRSQRLRRRN